MNELITDLRLLHEETLNNLKSSKANNTLRAYKSDFKDFGLFCAKHGLDSLPTEPKIVSLYLTNLSKNLKMSTPSKRIAFHTMGCKLNFSESATISRDFNRQGFEQVDYQNEADI